MKDDLNVLILAPVGRDGALASEVLNKAKVQTEIMKDVSHLSERLKSHSGAVIVTEEAIGSGDLDRLYQAFSGQESWSDLPMILVTSEKQKFERTKIIIDRFGEVGNISVLERPFSVMTLITMTNTALRARKKQYEIRKLISKLNVEIESKDEFMSIASHELKTPLTSLKLQVQLKKHLAMKGDLSLHNLGSMDRFLSAVDTQTDRLARLVDDMLDISRIENGRLSLNKERCDLNVLATHVVDLFQAMAESSGSVLELRTNSELVGMWDKDRVEQVLLNLITNALKYAPKSKVSVSVEHDEAMAKIHVRDRGPGISKEAQQKIFGRYERGTKERDTSGLGLGLYISQEIAHMHGGKLSVESAPDKGATFTLSLPLAQ